MLKIAQDSQFSGQRSSLDSRQFEYNDEEHGLIYPGCDYLCLCGTQS